MNQCPECEGRDIEKEYDDRYSSEDSSIFHCYCKDCNCEFDIEEETTITITQHGSTVVENNKPLALERLVNERKREVKVMVRELRKRIRVINAIRRLLGMKLPKKTNIAMMDIFGGGAVYQIDSDKLDGYESTGDIKRGKKICDFDSSRVEES